MLRSLSGLITGLLVLSFAFGLEEALRGGRENATQVILKLLIAIGAAHVMSVCAALWFGRREPQWLVLAIGFAIVTIFYIGHLVHQVEALTAATELSGLWPWSQESVVCVVLLLSVLMVGATGFTDKTAGLAVAGLIAVSVALIVSPSPIEDPARQGVRLSFSMQSFVWLRLDI